MLGGVERRERGSTADAAWLAAIPCAAALVAVALLLGPAIGRFLYPTPTLQLLIDDPGTLIPEPGENTRYLLAVCTAALLTLATAVLARSRPWGSARTRRRLALCAQILLVGFVAVCFAAQHEATWSIAYFTIATLLAAVAIATALALAARSRWTRRAWLRPPASRAWKTLLWVVPLAAVAIWIVPGVNSERSIAWAPFSHDTGFHLDETFAVLNGLTPLVDFNAQYASLFPYAIALSMLTFGKTLLVFTISVCALSALALLAVYGVLRRAAGASSVALLLFLPFLATSLFDPLGIGIVHVTPGAYFAMIPFRYGGAYLLAWLVARRLGDERRGRTWVLFGAAGLVVLNNFEFGLVALAATIAALLWGELELRPRRLARLAASAGAGLASALAVYAAFALVRAGALPNLGRMPQFARLYGLAGYSVAPIPSLLGLPTVIYLTYAAALTTATVRAVDRAPNRVLTGMLAWSAVFGLGSATYYVARSDTMLLSMTFSAWALALALLTLTVLRGMATAPARRPSLAALAVLFGFGLAVCSVVQVPFPWSELQRVRTQPAQLYANRVAWAPPPSRAPGVERFIGAISAGGSRFVVRRGAPIALFLTTGHRVADAYGVVDVVPFTGPESMHTVEALDEALEALLHAGGNTVLLQAERIAALHEPLENRGFRLLTTTGLRTVPLQGPTLPRDALVVGGLTKWVDTTHLHAAWLN